MHLSALHVRAAQLLYIVNLTVKNNGMPKSLGRAHYGPRFLSDFLPHHSSRLAPSNQLHCLRHRSLVQLCRLAWCCLFPGLRCAGRCLPAHPNHDRRHHPNPHPGADPARPHYDDCGTYPRAIKKNSPTGPNISSFASSIWTFLLFAIIRRPILYNSWRHLYFLYGPMLILAVAAVRFLVQRARANSNARCFRGRAPIAGLALLIGISHLSVRLLQPLAGKDPARSYEFDYWNVSQTQMLMKLADQIDGDEVNVCATDWYTADGLAKADKVLPEAYKDRVGFSCTVLGMKTDADYLVVNRLVLQVMEAQNRQQTPTWLYTQGNLLGLLPKYPPVASLRAFGSDFMTVYSLNKK